MNPWKWWISLRPRERRLYLGGGLLFLVILAGAGVWVAQPRYVPLFPGASRQGSAALMARMETLKIAYRIDPQSGEVLVRDREAEAVRAQLQGKGIASKGAVGFEIFDNGDFGMTEFTERINYQRALEGELARTIMALDDVNYARVHLVLPQTSLFRTSGDSPKASVLLIEHPGSGLSQAQVVGIQRLVSSAVAGLSPEAVSIHNQHGIDLTPEAVGAVGGSVVTSEVQAKEAAEAYFEGKVYDSLSHLLDRERISVSVDATIENAQVTSTREEWSPGLPEEVQGASRAAGPLDKPAAAENPFRNAKTEAAAATGADRSGQMPPVVGSRLTREWEQSERGPGDIKRLSVAVLLPDPSPSGVSIDQIKELVGAAVGADAQRGDRIAVYAYAAAAAVSPAAHPAPNALQAVGKPAVEPGKWPAGWLTPFLAGLLAAGVGLAMVRMLVPRRSGAPELGIHERNAVLEQVRQWLRNK